MTSDGFPSMKARALLRLLYRLGYECVSQSGSHRKLKHAELPPILFAWHDKANVPPGVVRSTLTKEVGLSIDEALEAIRG